MAIDLTILREAQLIMLDMLVEFDAICKKHNLQYWLDSGTLLGAVRHKGFIPWDDDIDISMPIEDYLTFQKIAVDELSSDIFLQTKQSDKSFLFDYMKLRSNRASIIEFHEKDKEINYHQGIFVDIFPMLSISNTKENKQFYSDILKLIREASAVSLHTPEGKNLPKIREKLVASLRELHQGWENNKNMVIYSGEMPDSSTWFEQNKLFPLKKITFEGIEFNAPNDLDHYLTSIYSFDYTTIPPPEKRRIHAHKVLLHKSLVCH